MGRTLALAGSYGRGPENVCLLGLSQGACLTLEYAARPTICYGGVLVFTGSLLGEQLYAGDFAGTLCLVVSIDPNSHVSAARLRAYAALFSTLGRVITKQIMPSMGYHQFAAKSTACQSVDS